MGILRRSYPGVFTGIVGLLGLVSQEADAQVVITFDPISGVPIPRWMVVLTAIILGVSAALILRWRGHDLARFRSWFIGILSSGVLLSGAYGVNLLEDAWGVIWTDNLDLVTSPATYTLTQNDWQGMLYQGAGTGILVTNRTGASVVIRGRSIDPPNATLGFYSSYLAEIPECIAGTVVAPQASCYVSVEYTGLSFN